MPTLGDRSGFVPGRVLLVTLLGLAGVVVLALASRVVGGTALRPSAGSATGTVGT
ncbi:hypothetical protein [Actinocatenispora comari]|uniref:Uncharacterized protein n=1 Tax=Actinocatenispora comari TaxID=2807577 RepID=A0A8J4EMN9_9ACTN|nr:hypothetical protein [Actinocatenispora comari]GIL29395.1 hypothetical protein NUM_46490 [Actinocatenispora comari]